MSDLPNVGMADAPHEPALILYLPDQPLPALLADAALDASPQARRHARRTKAERSRAPLSAPTLPLPAVPPSRPHLFTDCM